VTDFEGFVPVPGGRIWAQAAGAGPALLLVHAGVADARMWDPQWDALAAGHRVVRYEPRGFGRTETDEVEFSDRADVLAVLDAVKVERAAVVGCSRGGQIAVDTAIEHPDRVSGLVWVCGGLSGIEIEDTPEEQALGEREEALYEAHDWAGLADLDVEIWVDGVGQPAGRGPAHVRRLVRQMCLDTYVQEKVEGRPIRLDPPAVGRLDEIRVPLLAIVGELDLPSVSIAAGTLVDGVAGARRIDVPGVAHLPSLERPEWFTETLLAFLAEIA
jgi:pimeloyl-ACP methyl ester carboxylesterase